MTTQNQMSNKPKAVIIGIDKLVSYTESWYEFISEVGINVDHHRKIYSALKKEALTWEEAKGKLFGILRDKNHNITKDRFIRVFERMEISGDAYNTIFEIKRMGFKIGIISGSIDLIVETIAKKLRIEDWYANTDLIFDDHGLWQDIIFRQNEAEVKKSQLEDFLSKHKLKPAECLIVGHSHSDVEMFKMCPGISLDSENEEINKLAQYELKFITRLPQLLASLL